MGVPPALPGIHSNSLVIGYLSNGNADWPVMIPEQNVMFRHGDSPSANLKHSRDARRANGSKRKANRKRQPSPQVELSPLQLAVARQLSKGLELADPMPKRLATLLSRLTDHGRESGNGAPDTWGPKKKPPRGRLLPHAKCSVSRQWRA
jgi:hypothetical protein